MCLPLSSAYATLDYYDFVDGHVLCRLQNTYVDPSTMKPMPSNATITLHDWYDAAGAINTTWTQPVSYATNPTSLIRTSFHLKNDHDSLFAAETKTIITYSGLILGGVVGGNTVAFNDDAVRKIDIIGYDSTYKKAFYFDEADVSFRSYEGGILSIDIDTGLLPFHVHYFSIDIFWDYCDAFSVSKSAYNSGSVSTSLRTGYENFKVTWGHYPSSDYYSQKISITTTEIKDEVVALPGKIGDAVGDVLNSALVPDADSVSEQQDKWNQLLSDRFGALYQVGDLVTDYAAAFVDSEQNTIDIPTVTIPLGEVDFTFGGWTVQVVPDGFEVVISALKLIVSIACTFLFVNGLKRRFEGLLGGAPTA